MRRQFSKRQTRILYDRIDIISRMYPPHDSFDEVFADKSETRPCVLCEYSHSMGKSNGDLADCWKQINKSDKVAYKRYGNYCGKTFLIQRITLFDRNFGRVRA